MLESDAGRNRIFAGLGQILEEMVRGEIGAQLVDRAEVERVKPDLLRGLDVNGLVVEEEGFFRANAELLAGVEIDGRVGFGNTELAGPGELRELVKPGKIATHAAEDFAHHVGEDGGADAGLLQRFDPGEHARVEEVGPQDDVGLDEGFGLVRREGEARVLGELLPKGGTVVTAEIVVVTVAPVVAFEGRPVEAGEGQELAVGSRIGLAEDFTVIKNDGAEGGIRRQRNSWVLEMRCLYYAVGCGAGQPA